MLVCWCEVAGVLSLRLEFLLPAAGPSYGMVDETAAGVITGQFFADTNVQETIQDFEHEPFNGERRSKIKTKHKRHPTKAKNTPFPVNTLKTPLLASS